MWIIGAINQSKSKLVKARTMLFSFLIFTFGCIFYANVCESRFNFNEFLSNRIANIMKPISYPKPTYDGCKQDPSKCPIGTFCYVPSVDCGFYPPSCNGICTPDTPKPPTTFDGCKEDPSICSLGNFCLVPVNCKYFPTAPPCRGVCTPGCQKPENCQSEEKCEIPPTMDYGYFFPLQILKRYTNTTFAIFCHFV